MGTVLHRVVLNYIPQESKLSGSECLTYEVDPQFLF